MKWESRLGRATPRALVALVALSFGLGCGADRGARDLAALDLAHRTAEAELRASIDALTHENEELRSRLVTLEARNRMSVAPAAFDGSPLGALCAAVVRLSVLSVRYGDAHPDVLAEQQWIEASRTALEARRAAGQPVDGELVLAAMLAELDRSRGAELELAAFYGAAHPERLAAATERTALEAAVASLRDHGSCEPVSATTPPSPPS